MRPSTAAMTIAPSTASGRFANSGARKIAVARMSPEVTSDDSCERAPAASPVAVWDRLASVTKPPNSPDARFADPSASSSWSASIS